MQQNVKMNAVRFKAAVNNMLPGKPVWTMDSKNKHKKPGKNGSKKPNFSTLESLPF